MSSAMGTRDRSADALTAAVAVAAYLSGLHGDWLDDDPLAIVNNRDTIVNETSLADVWANDFWGTPMASEQSHLSFRPLTIMSFRAQRALVGLHGLSFHVVNVGLHALATLGFARCCRPLVRRRSQRVAAALLFAVHAVHVESVTNTVGRSETLSAVAFFGAVLCYQPLLLPRPRRLGSDGGAAASAGSAGGAGVAETLLRIGGSLALAGVGMLCKEVSITSLLVCAALDCLEQLRRSPLAAAASSSASAGGPSRGGGRARPWSAFVARQLLLGGGAVALMVARLRLNGWRSPRFSGADNSAAFCATPLCRALSYSHLYWLNLRLLLLPDNLAHDWSMTTVPNLLDTSDARLPLAMLPYAALVAYGLSGLAALLRRRDRRSRSRSRSHHGHGHGHGGHHAGGDGGGDAGPGAALALLVLPFLPSAHVFVTVGFTVAERVLYLPSCGFCLAAALMLPPKRRPGRRGDGRRSTSTAIAAAGAACWRVAAACALCGALGMHGALTLRRNIDWRTNLQLLQAGVAHQPTNSKLQYNLGYAYHREVSPPRPDGALRHLSAALALLPELTEASCLQGAVLRELNRLGEAEQTLRAALRRAPLGNADVRLYFAYHGLGTTLRMAGRPAEALVAFSPALTHYNPGDASLAMEVAATAEAAGQPRAQAELLRHVLRLQPRHAAAAAALGALEGGASSMHPAPPPPPPPPQQQPQPQGQRQPQAEQPPRAQQQSSQWARRLEGRRQQGR